MKFKILKSLVVITFVMLNMVACDVKSKGNNRTKYSRKERNRKKGKHRYKCEGNWKRSRGEKNGYGRFA